MTNRTADSHGSRRVGATPTPGIVRSRVASSATFSGLLERLYAAPGTSEGWQRFLDGVCTMTGGSAASFITQDMEVRRRVTSSTIRDAAVIDAYVSHWAAQDPWGCSPKLAAIDASSVVSGEQLIAHTDMRRTAFYADFGRHHDTVRCLIALVEKGAPALSLLSINRSERQRAFGPEQARLLEALVPHLHQAVRLHRRLVAAETALGDFTTVLDRAAHAVLLIDFTGRITYVNRAGRDLTATRDGVEVDRGELRAASAAETDRLRALLADAVSTADGRGFGAGGVLSLGRPSGRRPLSVLIAPLPQRHDPSFDAGARAVAMVVVTDPERIEIGTHSVLGTLLGLTPAEAKLAHLLAQGLDLQSAAVRLGVRTETVRTRLKTIFEKTGTHRQADLVRLILGVCPRV